MPVEVARPTGAIRAWRCEVQINRGYGDRRSSMNERVRARRSSPQREGESWRRVSTYYGRSPSAHIVAAKKRRVERCFRETLYDAQLPEAACARREVRLERRVRV
eukprot:5698206-Pleurochrysis_carterae.AAC.2